MPSIVTDDFSELNENNILKEYKKLDRRRRSIKLQSFFGWKLAQLTSFKLLLEQFKPPLINAGFNHNAIPLNTNDLKEIFEFIKDKYEYSSEILYSKSKTSYDLQPQSLFNSYLLNVKKRKVNSIRWVYYDLSNLKNKNLDIEMFVINTSGDRYYKKNEYEYAKELLEIKFNIPTPYEIVSSDLSDYNTSYNTSTISDFISVNISNVYTYSSTIYKVNSTSINKLDNPLNNFSNDISNNILNNFSNIISNNILNNISNDIINNNELKINTDPKYDELNKKVKMMMNQINDVTNEQKLIEIKLKEKEKDYNNLLFYFKTLIMILVIIIIIYIINIICRICTKTDNYNKINDFQDN